MKTADEDKMYKMAQGLAPMVGLPCFRKEKISLTVMEYLEIYRFIFKPSCFKRKSCTRGSCCEYLST